MGSKISRRSFLKKIGIAGAGLLFSNIGNANEKISIYDLFSKLALIPELKAVEKPIFVSENYQTIILIEDIHKGEEFLTKSRAEMYGYIYDREIDIDQRWTVEKRQLEILKEKFNLNFVGIEGWNGENINKSNKLISGERILVRYLFSSSEFDLIPLEDKKIQIQGLEIYTYHEYILRDEIGIYGNDNFRKYMVNKYLELFNTGKEYNLSSEEWRIIKTYLINNFENLNSFDIIKLQNLVYDFMNFIEMFKVIIGKNFTNVESLNNQIKFFYEKLVKLYSKYDLDQIIELENNSIENWRNQYAVEKMLKEMRNNNKQIGIIVFGIGHTKGLVEEFKKQTGNKVNIYVAK